jgi:DNA invertase Pin-like site-specific DNA recombinase
MSIIPTHALERDLIVLIRQSTLIQKHENRGSGALQLSLHGLGLQLGWPEERIILLDARGESGSRGERAQFQELLRRVKSGATGAVALARSDRLGRTALESEELLRAAAEHGTLMITEGRIYDPSSASDKLILGLFNQFAEYENNARTLWMMATRLTLAKEGAYRVVMPTGLIAASPSDPAFMERLTEAGLASWVEDLDRHRTVSTRKGKQYFVLPYPDREVYEACRMRMECMLAHGSLNAVVEMINNDPSYPRAGLIPVCRAVRRYHSGIEIRWIDVNHPNGRVALRNWFKSPAIYGIYSFKSPTLAAKSPGEDPERFRVHIEDAFPSFANASDARAIKRILAEDKKPWREGSHEGPRPHLLSMLRCGGIIKPGGADGTAPGQDSTTRCGNLLTAMYQADGTWNYYSHLCRYEGHKTQHVAGNVVDSVVEQLLLAVFDQHRLEIAMQRLEVDEGAARSRLRALHTEQTRIQREMQGVKQAIIQAEIDGVTERKILWNHDLDSLIGRQQLIERQIAEAHADVEEFLGLVRSDRTRVLRLGSDLTRLLPMVRESSPDQLRALVGTMVDTIYFERISSHACRIEVVFPGGATVQRTFVTRGLFVPRTAVEYAAGRLREGAEPATIAAELNVAKPKDHRVPWDEDRVLTAPHALEHQPFTPLREGRHRTVSEIAESVGAQIEDVLIPAFHGNLGPGYYEKGQLYICPTLEELHRWVPAAARYDVAVAMGWNPEGVVTRSEVSQVTGLSRYQVVSGAKRRSGLGQDESGRHWVVRSDFP